MNDTTTFCLLLIPALPLAAALIVAALGPWVLKENSHWPVILALFGSFLLSALLVVEVQNGNNSQKPRIHSQETPGYEKVVTLWNWANVPAALDYQGFPGVNGDLSQRGPRDFRIDVTLRADALTSLMLCMVTFVATLVAVFAAGYMHGDPGYWRFFSYIGLFVFSMTMLVSVSNFALLFVFWEAVGVCSYLLIGFWYTKPAAAAAGMKAFLVNRVGDFGFALAIFLIWTTYGTLNYHDTTPEGETDDVSIAMLDGKNLTTPSSVIRGVLGKSRLLHHEYATGHLGLAICLLLLLGACGKSAQFPLHVWLPDAMEGPTPVSALIHAATMVTAGVYMVARCTPLFAASPESQLVVSVVGAFTALLAGLIALTQFDLKRVLAYSTVSQLGFMFLALGTGLFSGVTGGMFHLFTHAFFKALLFLGAGSVMHAMGGVIDMRQFGGLRRLMPHTHWTFLLGCVALAGIPPLAGFWSKDAVLGAVHEKIHLLEHAHEHHAGNHDGRHEKPFERHALESHISEALHEATTLTPAQLKTYAAVYTALYYSALFTAFLTAFYTFRAFCLTFYGKEKIPAAAGHHAHESPPQMLAPLWVLAVGAVIIGGVFVDWRDLGHNFLVDFLGTTPSLATGLIANTRLAAPEFHLSVAGAGSLAGCLGVGLALFLYLGDRKEATLLARLFNLEGLNQLTDPQWVPQLREIWWIGMISRGLDRVHLGWILTLIGYLLAIVSLVLCVPLLLLGFVTPYKLSLDKFYIDEIYQAVIVTPLRYLAKFCYWIDRVLVDGLVNFTGALPPLAGGLMRSLQMGLVQFYALAMLGGALLLIVLHLIQPLLAAR